MFARLLVLASLANILLLTNADNGCADPNAVRTACGSNCGKTCVKTKICPQICKQNGCSCKDGFLFNANTNKCVLPNQYDGCADPNAMVTPCGGNCGKTCVKSDFCTLICLQNGCSCKDGFLFDAIKNKCVEPKHCTNSNTCGTNEVFSKCINNICSAVNCSQLGNSIPCSRPDVCESGCVCKAGFLRDNSGNCVRRSQCQIALCPNQNEIFDPCPKSCPPQTCESIGKKFNCPLIPANATCKPACRCNRGFFRNAIGECISEANCKKCNGSNEFYSCGGACDNICSNLSEQNQTNCPIINIVCNKMCYCKSGFARNKNGTCIPINKCPVPDNKSSIADFNQGNNAFTGGFLYQMFQMNNGKSFVASPFSVLIPLAQLGLFAEGTTFDQIIAVLNLKNKDQIRSVFTAIIQNYEQQEQILLLLAAKIYSDIDFPLSSKFLKQSLQILDAEGQNINFGNPMEATDIVNSWVSNKTDGFIKDLVNPSFFTEDTRLVLANVIYFLGNWSKPFDENKTMKRDFFLNSNNSIQIKIMFQENTFNYLDSSTLNSQIVQLSYKGGNVSCVIVLPKEKDGINDLVNKSRDGTALLKALKEATFQKVRLFLPIIETTSNINLQTILQELNVTSLFDFTSDLQGILQNPEQLQVTNAIQKCRIKVNEKGTEAAAANGNVHRMLLFFWLNILALPFSVAMPPACWARYLLVVGSSIWITYRPSLVLIGVGITSAQFPEPEIFEFVADHPFLYYILLEDAPIFCGIFAGPQ